MSKEKRRVPKLRFPGFTEDWEQRKLGAMCSLFIDGDWIESKDQSNEGIRLIQTGNIGVGKFIDKPENKKWISHSTFNNLRCKELLDGDILISRLPQPAGRACIVNTNNEKWITAVDCTIVRLLDQYSNKFILQSLCTYNYFHLIDSFLAGGTRQRVSRSNLSDINIMSPKKIEQDKIGLFFEYVDNLITLHQRKLEHLNLKKKALLQKLFPKDGERYPELRFPGFTDAWEQRKLGAMCSLFIDGDWIESKDQSNEGIRLIQTGNIGVGKFIDKPENKKWISHSTFNNLRCKELLDGDILISRLPQPAGRACIVNTNNEKWITAVDCTIVRLLDQYSNKFILQSLCTYNYFHLIDSFLAGGTRQRVSRSNLSDINIMSPKKIEQDKIGLFFEYVDNLITLHQRKLEDLQLQKKALLQQMFV